ncbi:hypothetical protein RI065_06440 [Mycoplasmatota bacterium zrk1]
MSKISKKKIEIVKHNSIDKGHLIFKKEELPTGNRVNYSYTGSINLIRRQIRKSKHITLVVSDNGIHKSIMDEIEQSQDYIDFIIVTKKKSLIKSLSCCSNTEIIVDEDVSINCICVDETYCYLMSDKIYEMNIEGIELFTSRKKIENNLCTLVSSNEVFINLNRRGLFDLSMSSARRNIYAMSTSYYSEEHYNTFYKINDELFVSYKVVDGFFTIDNDGNCYKLLEVKEGLFIKILISIVDLAKSLSSYSFKLLKMTRLLNVNKLTNSMYKLEDKKVEQIDIKEEKEIVIEVECDTIDDFLGEVFDSAETDNHNEYSLSYKKVKYSFILHPPKMIKKLKLSKLYDPYIILVNKISNELEEFLSDFTRTIDVFGSASNDIISFIGRISELKDYLESTVNDNLYSDVHHHVLTFNSVENLSEEKLISIFMELYDTVISGRENTKLNKISEEINHKVVLAKEKKDLIDNGVEIKKNKFRLQSLNSEIKDLNNLKSKFMNKLEIIAKKERDNILNFCKLDENLDVDNNKSLVKILDTSNTVVIERFIKNNVHNFVTTIRRIDEALHEILNTDIPSEFLLYESDECDVFSITSFDEIERAKAYESKYNAKICVGG